MRQFTSNATDLSAGEQFVGLQLLSRYCARSALFLDPMLLCFVTNDAVAIAAAIPVHAGSAGRWGTAIIG